MHLFHHPWISWEFPQVKSQQFDQQGFAEATSHGFCARCPLIELHPGKLRWNQNHGGLVQMFFLSKTSRPTRLERLDLSKSPFAFFWSTGTALKSADWKPRMVGRYRKYPVASIKGYVTNPTNDYLALIEALVVHGPQACGKMVKDLVLRSSWGTF